MQELLVEEVSYFRLLSGFLVSISSVSKNNNKNTRGKLQDRKLGDFKIHVSSFPNRKLGKLPAVLPRRYKIEHAVGAGHFTRAYLATDLESNTKVQRPFEIFHRFLGVVVLKYNALRLRCK